MSRSLSKFVNRILLEFANQLKSVSSAKKSLIYATKINIFKTNKDKSIGCP